MSRLQTAAAVTVVMVAFAANSLLARAAIGLGTMSPAGFTAWRLGSGAVTLLTAALFRRRNPFRPWPGWTAAGLLLIYMMGFALAYRRIDAGTGALLLFVAVQLTMFAAAIYRREPIPGRRWFGSLLSLAALVGLLWPTSHAGAPPLAGALAMLLAGAAWGGFTLAGRRQRSAFDTMTAAFVLAAPPAMLPGIGTDAAPRDLALAVLSGSVTSAAAYGLWYAVLPRLSRVMAATSQLTVPLIAALLAMVWPGEMPSPRLWTAGAVMLCGIALVALTPPAAIGDPLPPRQRGNVSPRAASG